MLQTDLAFTPAWRLRELIAARQVSPVELVELYLRRIETYNGSLNAYLTVTAEEALAEARTREQEVLRGEAQGPLHGLPIAIKDLEATRGIRTTEGSLVFKNRVPEEDSREVERVRAAGAIILGKTNTSEFGQSGTTENRLGDACRNPWDLERTSGGSSGGSAAAVAAGLCALATGSDGGGSIRIPASFCGVYGLKPTQGRVPRSGRLPTWNPFAQSGPIVRTVRDAALLLQVLAGPDRRDPGSLREQPPDFLAALDLGVRGLRLAWSPDLGYAAVDAEVVETTARAARLFEELGCRVEEPGIALHEPFPPFNTIFAANTYAAYGHLLESHGDQLTDYARNVMEIGLTVSGADFSRALRAVEEMRAQLTDLLEEYDLLLTPTLAVAAFPVEQRPRTIGGREVDPRWGFFPFTFPFNMAGQPAASIPCGFSDQGLPIGLQIVGRRGEETTVLRASAAFEAARPWAERRPPVS